MTILSSFLDNEWLWPPVRFALARRAPRLVPGVVNFVAVLLSLLLLLLFSSLSSALISMNKAVYTTASVAYVGQGH